ncbi:hypothetical protein SVIOM74S_03076 [Streptomyces violarus]
MTSRALIVALCGVPSVVPPGEAAGFPVPLLEDPDDGVAVAEGAQRVRAGLRRVDDDVGLLARPETERRRRNAPPGRAAEAPAPAARRTPCRRRTGSRAVALARRCQGARTPALSGLVLGELTVRQRQVVTLAAAGLSNRQIAERLTLSIRTVGNHLYSAYARLGASDRGALPLLTEVPQAQPAEAAP